MILRALKQFQPCSYRSDERRRLHMQPTVPTVQHDCYGLTMCKAHALWHAESQASEVAALGRITLPLRFFPTSNTPAV